MWRLWRWLIRLLELVVIVGGLVMCVHEGVKAKPDGAVMAAWLAFVSTPVTVRTVLYRRGPGSSPTGQVSESSAPDSSSRSPT